MILQTPAATRQENFVMAGVITDVCVIPPGISALEEGFNVKVVCDACGSTNQIAEEMSWRRMEKAGVILASTGIFRLTPCDHPFSSLLQFRWSRDDAEPDILYDWHLQHVGG